MTLVRFPPGEPVFTDHPFHESLFGEVDRLLAEGYCPEGWLDLESSDVRLTCLIHQSKPYLAGLSDPAGFFWMPLGELPQRARQLTNAVCGLYNADPVRVLMMAVHFRNRPELQAATNLVDLGHVLAVLAQEGNDAALALERAGTRTLMFLQKGIPARLYFGEHSDDPGEGSITDRFLRFGFAPDAPVSRVEVFHRLNIEPDPDAGWPLARLDQLDQPPPPTNVLLLLDERLLLQRSFMPPCMFIGRDLACELRLDELSISRRHAKLCWDLGRFLIEDLGSANGIRVNGERVSRHTLSHDDVVQVGRYEIRLAPAEAEPRRPTVMMSASSDGGQLYLFEGERSLLLDGEITIGRAQGVDMPIRGLFVRPIHAKLQVKDSGEVRLTCVGKATVSIKGENVSSAALSPGDEFHIGRSSFKLVEVPNYLPLEQ